MNHRPLTALSAALALALSPALLAHEGSKTGAAVEPAAETAVPAEASAQSDTFGADYSDSTSMEAGTDTDAIDSTVAATAEVDFDSLDANADGFLAQDEIPPGSTLADGWVDHDLDGDLQLSPSEFDGWSGGAGTDLSAGVADADTAAGAEADADLTTDPFDVEGDLDADLDGSVATDAGEAFEDGEFEAAEDFE